MDFTILRSNSHSFDLGQLNVDTSISHRRCEQGQNGCSQLTLLPSIYSGALRKLTDNTGGTSSTDSCVKAVAYGMCSEEFLINLRR